MAKEIIVEEGIAILLSKQEATELVFSLISQLTETPIRNNQMGGIIGISTRDENWKNKTKFFISLESL